MPKWWRQSTRMSATDVRELVSSAMRRISRSGTLAVQRDRGHRAVGADADAGHEPVVGSEQKLDARCQAEVHLAGPQQIGAQTAGRS